MNLLKRIKFWKNADRLGPDIPYTHWRLFFPDLMMDLCKRKFKYFGEGAEFRPGAFAISCSKISLGKNVIIRPTTMLFADTRDFGEGIKIADDVMLGSGVHIYSVNHKFDNPEIPIINQGHSPSRQVILCEGCWIGANTIILPGVIVGKNSVVGAGSVVTKSIPDKVLAAGNPAKIIREL